MKKQQDEQKRQLVEMLFEMRSLPQDTTTEQMADFLLGRGVCVGRSERGDGITKGEVLNFRINVTGFTIEVERSATNDVRGSSKTRVENG